MTLQPTAEPRLSEQAQRARKGRDGLLRRREATRLLHPERIIGVSTVTRGVYSYGLLTVKPNFLVKRCILLYYPRYALSDCHWPHCLSLSQAITQHQTTDYMIELTMLI